MKRYDVIVLYAPLIETMQRLGITGADVRRAKAFGEYCSRKAEGEKVEAIVYDLCQRHGLSRRKMFAAFKRMKEDITV